MEGMASPVSGTSVFIADVATTTILARNFTVESGAAANGTASNAVSVQLTDTYGNELETDDVEVTFVVTGDARFGSVSGADTVTVKTEGGVASTRLVSTVAGSNAVTATMEGMASPVSGTSVFIADVSSARIDEDDLIVFRNNALPNGTDTNIIVARVTDSKGNVLPGIKVGFSASLGDLSAASVITDAEGRAYVQLTHTASEKSTVTASVNGVNYNIDCSFTSPSMSLPTIVKTKSVANGEDANEVRFQVITTEGTAVDGQAVSFTVSNGSFVESTEDDLSTTVVITDAEGWASVAFRSITAGDSIVIATLEIGATKIERRAVTDFIADASTAALSSVEVQKDGSPADGTTANRVIALVKDLHGNPVPDQIVTFTADNGGTITGVAETGDDAIGTASAKTDAGGIATVSVTNVNAGTTKVTATFGEDGEDSVDTAFVSHFASTSVAVAVAHKEGAKYREVAIGGIHPEGTDTATPIVGSTWQATLSCTSSVLEGDCVAARFDFNWKLKDSDAERDAAGANGSSTYTIMAADQKGQLFVEVTPKPE